VNYVKCKELNVKKLLLVEEDIMQSLNDDISKILVSTAYSDFKEKEINHKSLFYAIKRQIVAGCSDFKTMKDILDFHNKKEYYIINNGDKYENQITNPYSR